MGVSATDTIVQAPPVDFFAQTRKYVIARPTPLAATEVDYVLSLYRDTCLTGNVDPEILLSQMVHETAGLTSEWSLPPKRNPAGIGVTGGFLPDGVTPAGQWFNTWHDAITCHVGGMLAMRFPAGGGNAAQRRLIDFALSIRPGFARGAGPTVGDVAAKWAADPTYVTRLDEVSAAIRKA